MKNRSLRRHCRTVVKRHNKSKLFENIIVWSISIFKNFKNQITNYITVLLLKGKNEMGNSWLECRLDY